MDLIAENSPRSRGPLTVLLLLLAASSIGHCGAWSETAFSINSKLPRNCGFVPRQSTITEKQFFPRGTWPFIGVLWRNSILTICNVVLIHPEIALTPFLCISSNTNDVLEIEFSTPDLPTYQRISVSFVHFSNKNSRINSVAALKLDRPATINENVQPICLWEDNSDYISQLTNHIGLVVGPESTNDSTIRNFQKAVAIMDRSNCRNSDITFDMSTLDKSICVLYKDVSNCHYISSVLVFPRLNVDGKIVWYLRGIQTQKAWYCRTGANSVFYDTSERGSWIRSHFKITQTCGRRVDAPIPLVIRGEDTKRGEWPWHAALYYARNNNTRYAEYKCGGTLISQKYVISAAHCIPRDTGLQIQIVVLLGKYDLIQREPGVILTTAEQIIVHENYDPTTFRNDISLLRLKDTITYNNYIQPICLWDEADKSKRRIYRKIGTVPGWGTNENDELPNQLSIASLPIIEDSICIEDHKLFRDVLSSNNFCAGTKRDSTVWTGDSGGGFVLPITQNDHLDTWYLRGIVSISPPKAANRDENHYVIFTDVVAYSDWISKNTAS